MVSGERGVGQGDSQEAVYVSLRSLGHYQPLGLQRQNHGRPRLSLRLWPWTVMAGYAVSRTGRTRASDAAAPASSPSRLALDECKLLAKRAVTCNLGAMAVRERVSAYRARMRAQGLRPVQIWVPDVRSPDFAAEAHRQSALVAAADRASDDMDFVEAISDDWAE